MTFIWRNLYLILLYQKKMFQTKIIGFGDISKFVDVFFVSTKLVAGCVCLLIFFVSIFFTATWCI